MIARLVAAPLKAPVVVFAFALQRALGGRVRAPRRRREHQPPLATTGEVIAGVFTLLDPFSGARYAAIR